MATAKIKDSYPGDIAAMGFEQSLEELEKIISKLESGKSKLDDAIGDYERGAALQKRCQDLLAEAESRVQKIMVQKDGTLKTESFE